MQIIMVGEAQPIPAAPGDTILAALLRAGVPFPFSCQTGSCGSCKCRLLAGDIVLLEHSHQALGAEEQVTGMVLACRAQLAGDVVVSLPGAER